jgi:hypothetical protein
VKFTDERNLEGEVMKNKHTRMTWGSEMARLQRQRAERRAKSVAQMPSEVKMNLAKVTVPLIMGQPAFKTNSGWVNDDAGLLTVVSTALPTLLKRPSAARLVAFQN